MTQDFSQFKTFVKALTKYDSQHQRPFICYQCYHDLEDQVTSYKFRATFKLEAIFKYLCKQNEKNFCCSLAVNEMGVSGDFSKGKTVANVSRFRGQTIDIDHFIPKAVIRELIDLWEPTIVTLTSRNPENEAEFKAHFYFLYTDSSPQEFEYLTKHYRTIQQTIAYRAEKTVNKLLGRAEDVKVTDKGILAHQALRAPGFLHNKNKDAPHLVQIAYLDDEAYTEPSDIDKILKRIGVTKDDFKETTEKETQRKTFISKVSSDDPLYSNYPGADSGDRHNTLFNYTNNLIFKRRFSHNEALGSALYENLVKNDPPLEESEVEGIVEGVSKKYFEALTEKTRKKIENGDGLTCFELFKKEAEKISEKLFQGGEGLTENQKKDFAYDYNNRKHFAEFISDTSILYRLHQRYSDKIKTNPKLGTLVYTDETGTFEEDTGHVNDFLNDIIVDMPSEPVVRAQFLDKKGAPSDIGLYSYISNLRSGAKKGSLFSLLGRMKEFYLDHKQFDKQSNLINCTNGVIDLSNGKLLNHSPSYLMTNSLAVPYISQSHKEYYRLDSKYHYRKNAWLKFIYEIMDGDLEMCRFLQVIFGYALRGDLPEQCLFFFQGGGLNGKSKCLETILELFGSYGKAVSNKMYITHQNLNENAYLSEIAQLLGKRFVLAGEIEKKDHLNQSAVKDVTTGAKVIVKKMGRDTFELSPQFTSFLQGNSKPIISGNDLGIWRRITMVPFFVDFKANPDLGLGERLKSPEVLKTILPWVVAGNLIYQEEGLKIPNKSLAAKDEYKYEMVPYERFLSDCFLKVDEPSEAREIGLSCDEVYSCFLTWAELNDQESLHKTAFGKIVKNLGILSTIVTGGRIYPLTYNEKWEKLMLQGDNKKKSSKIVDLVKGMR